MQDAILKVIQTDVLVRRMVGGLGVAHADRDAWHPEPLAADDLALWRRINELYTAHPFHGSRKITAVLKAERYINRKAVQHHMHLMGIAGICPRPYLSQRAREHRVYPYRLRHLRAAYPNHVWGIDTLAPERKCRCHLHPPARRLAVSGGRARLAAGAATQ